MPKTLPAHERVLARTVAVGDCLLFDGYIMPDGYGVVGVGSRSDGTRGTALAHVVIYEHHHGPVPDGHEIDHTCHTEAVRRGECNGGQTCPHRACCRIEHLEAVTTAENRARGVRPQRTHCDHGHEFTPANTITTKDGKRRRCRTCAAETTRRYRARRRAQV